MTIKDIARIAGVSESTVSRSLRDHPRIPAETRDRIKKLARDNNLVINSNARSLSTSRCQTVGIVYPDFANFNQSAYLDLLVHDLRHVMEGLGYDCLIFQATRSDNGESNIDRLVLQKKVDGFLFVISEMAATTWELVASLHVPVVQVHSKPLNHGGVSLDEVTDFYFTDNYQGGRMAGEHLASRGAKNLACLADIIPGPEMLDRTRGFIEGLSDWGIRPHDVKIHHVTCEFDPAYRYVRDHIDDFATVQGLFAHTDLMAIAAIHALRDHGIRVPDHVKVMGFDDIPMTQLFRPALTTIHQPRETQALRAGNRLHELISGTPSGQRIQEYINPVLVVREST